MFLIDLSLEKNRPFCRRERSLSHLRYALTASNKVSLNTPELVISYVLASSAGRQNKF